jgi:hypothetical protein
MPRIVGCLAIESLTVELLEVGLTGQVTVSGWDGNRIPFVSDTVNVVVSDRAVTEEMRRVLAPYGVRGGWFRSGTTLLYRMKRMEAEKLER